MQQLKENLQAILSEKEKLTPDIIKKGVNIFGVEGTHEGSSLNIKNLHIFETEDDMNNDQTSELNDIGLLYNKNISNILSNTKFMMLYLENEITIDNYKAKKVENEWGTSYEYFPFDSEDGDYSVSMGIVLMEDNIQINYNNGNDYGNIIYRTTDNIHFIKDDNTPNIIMFNKYLKPNASYRSWDSIYEIVLKYVDINTQLHIYKQFYDTSEFKMLSIDSFKYFDSMIDATNYIRKINTIQINNILNDIKNNELKEFNYGYLYGNLFESNNGLFVLIGTRNYGGNYYGINCNSIINNHKISTSKIYGGSWGYSEENLYGYKNSKLFKINLDNNSYDEIPITEECINVKHITYENGEYSSSNEYVIYDFSSISEIGDIISLVESLPIGREITERDISLNPISFINDDENEDIQYYNFRIVNSIFNIYNKYAPIPKPQSDIQTSVDSASYYDNESRQGINYVLYCKPSKNKNIDGVQFNVELNAPWFYNRTSNYNLNMNVRPLNDFKLGSMDIVMKLFGKDGEIIWSCERKGVGITNDQYYAGPTYWTSTDSGFTSNMWPTIEQFMNAFDFDVDISNVKEFKYIEDSTVSTNDFGSHSYTIPETPINLELKNGVEPIYNEPDIPESNISYLLIKPKSYIETEDIFSDKDNFTIALCLKVLTPAAKGWILSHGMFYNGYGIMYMFNDATRLKAHYYGSGESGNGIDSSILEGDTPHSLIMTKEGNNIKVYIDGKQEFSYTGNYNGEGNLVGPLPSDSKLKINYGPLWYNDYSEHGYTNINMELYSFRYFDKILNEEEIRQVTSEDGPEAWI